MQMKKEEFKNIKLLYVEDEEQIRRNAISYFNRLFDEVYEAKNAFDALELVKEVKPHILITDIKMPKMSGLELVKKIREFDTKTQIIILTAFTDTNYLLEAVELGLVKYLVKPIRHDKMLPVLMQCAKNINTKESNLKYITNTCIFDTFNKSLVYENKVIKLSKNELKFLELLCLNNNRVVTYEEIENNIWYDSYMSEDAIRSLVRNLRRKLPKDSLNNISRVGYKISSI